MIILLKMYFLRLQMLSSFSINLCFSSGQRSCVGMLATEHNLKKSIFPKKGNTVEHN